MNRNLDKFRKRLTFLAAFLTIIGSSSYAAADNSVYLSGHVDGADGKALQNALIAIYNDKNQIVDYAHTDNSGNYLMSVPEADMHLPRQRGRSFLSQVFGLATHLVGGAAIFLANPLRAGIHAVASSEAASLVDPLAKGGLAAGSIVVDEALFAVSPRPPKPKEARKEPGVLLVKVVAPGHSDLVGIDQIYWMEEDTFHAAGRTQKITAAWMDPIHMADLDSNSPSRVYSNYLVFQSARLAPSLVNRGQVVKIYANLPTPPEPAVHIIVVARDNRNGEVWQLHPAGNGYYEGDFTVDKRFPYNDQIISILAYPALQQSPGRRLDAESAILHSGLWNPNRPYVFNPLLLASRNRADLTLTVLPSPGK